MTIEIKPPSGERADIALPGGAVLRVGDEVRSRKRPGAPSRHVLTIEGGEMGVRVRMSDGGRPIALASLMKDYEIVAPPPPPPAKEAAPVPPPPQKAEQVPLVLAAPQPATATQPDSLDAFMSVRRAIQAETRRALIADVLRCTRDDMPPHVDEMVRSRIFARNLVERMGSHAIVREMAAIMAAWLERGAP